MLEHGIRSSMWWSADHQHLNKLFQFAATEQRFAPALQLAQERLVAELTRHVAEGVQEGRLRQGDPELLTYAMLGALNQLTRGWTPGHFGLIAMRERVEALGGRFRVTTAPGEGTVVEARLPLTDRSEGLEL